MRLILHIGHPKCGSTAVQDLLRKNAASLARQKVFLLGDGLAIDPRGNDVNWPLWFVNDAAPRPDLFLQALDEQWPGIEAAKPDMLVLSAENLSLSEIGTAILPLVKRCDTSLIYYVRRQDHFLVSSWRQWGLKRGISLPQHLLRRVAEGKPDYLGVLEFWRAFVPADKMHVRFLDPHWLSGGNLGADFFSALGVEPEDRTAAAATNPSPDRSILLLLAQHRELFSSVDDDRAIQALAQLDEEPPRKLELDAHIQRSLKLIYDEANARLASEYMGRGDGTSVIATDGPKHVDYWLNSEDRARLTRIVPRLSDASLRTTLEASLRASG